VEFAKIVKTVELVKSTISSIIFGSVYILVLIFLIKKTMCHHALKGVV